MRGGDEKKLLQTRMLLLTTWSVIAVVKDLNQSEKGMYVKCSLQDLKLRQDSISR